MDNYTSGKKFSNTAPPPKGTYEDCEFLSCHWNEADLSGFNFTDCTFRDSDLSLARVQGTTINGVVFHSCRLTGVHFDVADPHLFDAAFTDCLMTLVSFWGRNLTGTTFERCKLHEAEFTTSNLTDAVFANCQLDDAVFRECTLMNTDFSSSDGVGLQLSENNVRGAHFRSDQLPALVRSFELHITL